MPRKSREKKRRHRSTTAGVEIAETTILTSTVGTLGESLKGLGNAAKEAAKSLNEFNKTYASVAQLVERLPEEQEAAGSIPARSTTTLVMETVHDGRERRITTKLVGRDGKVEASAEGFVFSPKPDRILSKSVRPGPSGGPKGCISTRVERVEAGEEAETRERIKEFVCDQEREKERNKKVRRGRTKELWERGVVAKYGLN